MQSQGGHRGPTPLPGCNIHVVGVEGCPCHADYCQGQREKDHDDCGTAATRKAAGSSIPWEEMGSVLEQATQVCWKGWVADEGLSLFSAEKSFLMGAVPSTRLCRRKSASSPARMCPSPFPTHSRAERTQCHVDNTQAGASWTSWLRVPGRGAGRSHTLPQDLGFLRGIGNGGTRTRCPGGVPGPRPICGPRPRLVPPLRPRPSPCPRRVI